MSKTINADQFSLISKSLDADMAASIAETAELFGMSVNELMKHEDEEKQSLVYTDLYCTSNAIRPLNDAVGYYTISKTFNAKTGPFAVLAEARTIDGKKLFEDQYGNFHLDAEAAKEF